MKKKAKPWCSAFVHMEGVPRSQSVWDSRGQRKPLRLLAEEEVGVPRMEAGRALVFPGEEGRWWRGAGEGSSASEKSTEGRGSESVPLMWMQGRVLGKEFVPTACPYKEDSDFARCGRKG